MGMGRKVKGSTRGGAEMTGFILRNELLTVNKDGLG